MGNPFDEVFTGQDAAPPPQANPFDQVSGAQGSAPATQGSTSPFDTAGGGKQPKSANPFDEVFGSDGQTVTDYGVTLRKALDRTGAAMGYGLEKIGFDETGRAIRDFYHEREATAPPQSESFKRQEAMPWTEAIKYPVTALGKLAGDTLSAAPDMALATAAALATGGLGLPGAAGVVAGGGAGGAAFGLSGAERAAHEIETMPEAQLRETPAFAGAYAKTDPNLPDAERLALARKDIADTVAKATMGANVGVGAVVGPFGGLAGRVAEKALPSLAGRVAAGAIGGSTFMGGMRAAENAVRQEYVDPNTSLGEGVPDAMVGGGVFGGAHGAIRRPPPEAGDHSSRIDTKPGGDMADSLHGVADAAEIGRLNATAFPGSSEGNRLSPEQFGAFLTDTPAGQALSSTIADLRASGQGALADKLQVTSANAGGHVAGSRHYKGQAVDINSKVLTPDEQAAVAEVAKRYGLVRDVDGEPWHFSYRGQSGGGADYLARVRQAESGGDDNAKSATSSASGPYQFVDNTWRSLVNQYGRDYGLTLEGKNDPAQQATAVALLTRDNREALRASLGREPSDGDLYMAHVFGRTGAERILEGMAENPGAEAISYASPATVRANRSLFFAKDHTRTLQEVYDLLAAKVAPKEGQGAPAATPAAAQSGTWPLRPELADIRQDMESRAPGIVEGQGNPWDTRLPSERIDAAFDLNRPLGRQAEAASLRQDILARDAAIRAAAEMGAPIPAVAAERINRYPALPEGQGFDFVPHEDRVDVRRGREGQQARLDTLNRTPALPEGPGFEMVSDAMRRDRLPVRLTDSPTMPEQGVRFHLNEKPAEAFRGITPEEVAHGIQGYTETAPGAAPVRIVRSQDELPPHLLEEYRQSGQRGGIEGVYDRSTSTVWLVADNLESKSRAGEIWLHENVAHHGLRAVFGSDRGFDTFLRRNAKEFGYGDHIAMEEHIARLAEKMDVGETLTPKETSLWGRFVDYVRSWLVRHGWATPKDADLHTLLRESLTRMTREAGGQEAEAGARFRVAGQDKDVLERDTDAAVKAMAEGMKRDIGPLARWFGTPDYTFQKHPVAWKIYNIFRDRPNRAHEILHVALDLPDGSTVMDRWKALSDKDKAMVNRVIDVADVREIKRPAVEQWMAEQNIPEPAREMYRLMRGKYDALLEERLRPYKEMLEKGINPDIQYRDADGKLVTMSLKEAVGEMGRMQGFYAPRIRQNGDLAVLARRKLPGGDYEYARHHVEWKRQAKGLEKELRAQGWEITGMEPVARLGESTQQAIARVGEVAKVVESAAQSMKGTSGEAQKAFLESLVEELSTEIKARGFRSSAIRRTGREGRVVRGYIEDAGERFAQYAQRTSYGIAKMESAQEAVRTLFTTGPDGRMLLDPRREPRTFEMVQNYLQDQLRNAEKADRVISLGKSIATFKYLGLNPKSALVNLTTLATQVPPALRVYAGDSKVSLLRTEYELTRSLPDAMAWMLGKSRKGLNPEERAFLAEIQRKNLDDPQFAREVFKTYQATAGRVWSGAMNKAMLMFGATEQFNRLSTQLAGYRVARLAGATHQEAMARALLASDRAHGATAARPCRKPPGAPMPARASCSLATSTRNTPTTRSSFWPTYGARATPGRLCTCWPRRWPWAASRPAWGRLAGRRPRPSIPPWAIPATRKRPSSPGCAGRLARTPSSMPVSARSARSASTCPAPWTRKSGCRPASRTWPAPSAAWSTTWLATGAPRTTWPRASPARPWKRCCPRVSPNPSRQCARAPRVSRPAAATRCATSRGAITRPPPRRRRPRPWAFVLPGKRASRTWTLPPGKRSGGSRIAATTSWRHTAPGRRPAARTGPDWMASSPTSPSSTPTWSGSTGPTCSRSTNGPSKARSCASATPASRSLAGAAWATPRRPPPSARRTSPWRRGWCVSAR
ncbi:MAG: hypothetical protein AAGU21_13720 [Solidesulfovibrio sp.]|uniref:hypothetical protein n=1 Tax=Solidesulfovibrio sp. TaxID=2910990 RepID=UPI003158C3F0